MKEYIEREALLKEEQEIYYWNGLHDIYGDFVPSEIIRSTPAADVAPVRHGEWIHRRWTTEDDWGDINHRSIICSACNTEFINKEPTNYCPECGAKMKEKK